MSQLFPSTSIQASIGRRRFVQLAFACSPEQPVFKSTDVTGASFAKDLKLKDHLGNIRTMQDFKGKVSVVF